MIEQKEINKIATKNDTAPNRYHLVNFKSTANQIAAFLFLLGMNIVIFSFLASHTAALFFGSKDVYDVEMLRYINGLTQIGFWGLTAFECAFLFNNRKAAAYLQLNTGVSAWSYFLLILTAVLSLPALSHIIAWNENIDLPQCLSSMEIWMREQENTAAKIADSMLSGSSTQVLFANLVVVALIPAVCEEFLFRGLFIRWCKNHIANIHIVVIISACLFSAIHLQFYGFVPRFLLGLYLGYLFVWTGSLWTPIIAHFINNGMAVVVSYLYNNQVINSKYQYFGNVGDNYLLLASSVILTTVCIYFLYRKNFVENRFRAG